AGWNSVTGADITAKSIECADDLRRATGAIDSGLRRVCATAASICSRPETSSKDDALQRLLVTVKPLVTQLAERLKLAISAQASLLQASRRSISKQAASYTASVQTVESVAKRKLDGLRQTADSNSAKVQRTADDRRTKIRDVTARIAERTGVTAATALGNLKALRSALEKTELGVDTSVIDAAEGDVTVLSNIQKHHNTAAMSKVIDRAVASLSRVEEVMGEVPKHNTLPSLAAAKSEWQAACAAVLAAEQKQKAASAAAELDGKKPPVGDSPGTGILGTLMETASLSAESMVPRPSRSSLQRAKSQKAKAKSKLLAAVVAARVTALREDRESLKRDAKGLAEVQPVEAAVDAKARRQRTIVGVSLQHSVDSLKRQTEEELAALRSATRSAVASTATACEADAARLLVPAQRAVQESVNLVQNTILVGVPLSMSGLTLWRGVQRQPCQPQQHVHPTLTRVNVLLQEVLAVNTAAAKAREQSWHCAFLAVKAAKL
ncbi:MAG: hypothetical protein VX446_01505, partial [Bacteroidota bacterium]|nr:hypothetical protein [Bacteroidota bacterium]